jgi:hypothetical protein
MNVNRCFIRISGSLIATLLICVAPKIHAGETLKWEQIPKAVQDTVLANGGTAGQSVDKEGAADSVGGKTTYDAPVKKNGKSVDLVITEDGKLVETKGDDSADASTEKSEVAKKLLEGIKFSHPRDINNPYLPIAKLKQDILEGTEGGKKIRIERTLMPDKHKTFTINGQQVDSLVYEDRAFMNGKLEEVAIDYFAQDDNGTVYYLGEEVTDYDETGKVLESGKAESWTFGVETPVPGIVMPGNPKVGMKFKCEDVSKDIMESDEIMGEGETVTVPAGTFRNCIRVKEILADATVEYKWYAKGIGAVREMPSDGDEVLISHNGKTKNTGAKQNGKKTVQSSTSNATAAEVAAWITEYKAAHSGRGGKDWDINEKSRAEIEADPNLKRFFDLCAPDQRPVIPALAWEYGGKDHQWSHPEASALVYCVYTPVKTSSEHWRYDKKADHVTADVYIKFPDQNPCKNETGAAQVMKCLGDRSNIEILVDTASLNDGKDVGLNLAEASTDLYLLQPDGSRVLLYQGK